MRSRGEGHGGRQSKVGHFSTEGKGRNTCGSTLKDSMKGSSDVVSRSDRLGGESVRFEYLVKTSCSPEEGPGLDSSSSRAKKESAQGVPPLPTPPLPTFPQLTPLEMPRQFALYSDGGLQRALSHTREL